MNIMRHKHICLLIIFLFLTLIPAASQSALFKSFTGFRVIKTEYFDIIFPEESESSARLLASYADRVYAELSALLGIEVKRRISVTFAPHTDSFNGYYNSVFNHIMLYDTPMDIEWTTYENNLKNLFIHELTHAITYNSRSPFYRFLYSIFGSWASPVYSNGPSFMIEGVTVSFESLSGYGRANDPRIKQYLRQAVHENKFLTPFQASGVYDRSIQPSGYWYEYGGLFSAWLQHNYGMEKYAELWQAMGKTSGFSFFVYRSGFYRLFRKVYGIDFTDTWNEFKASLALDDLETNNDELIPVKYRYFDEKEAFIRGLAANGNNLYFFDRSQDKIGIYDTLTGKIRELNAPLYTYDIDVSSDGSVMLLSGYRYIEDRYTAVVTELNADNGRRTGRTIEGLYNARYFRNGVIGLRSNLHNNSIVYEDFDGSSEILLQGNENLMFSVPQALDDGRIVFIASLNGTRELWLFDYVSRELFRFESTIGEDGYRKYMRGLSVSEGKIFFSHNANDRMYKGGYIDPEIMHVIFNDRDFSGGVFNPVSINDTIYYLGAFVSRNSILRFPEPVSLMSGNQSKLQLVKLDYQDYGIAAEETETIANGLSFSTSSKKYHSLFYMNPLKFWFPVPLVRYNYNFDIKDIKNFDFNISMDGGGIFSIMADPTDRNLLTVLAFFDARYKMADIEILKWQNTSLGFPLTLDFSDTVEVSVNSTYRYTSAMVSGKISWSMGQWHNEFMLGGGYARRADYEDGKNAYNWKQTGSNFFVQTGFIHKYRRFVMQFSGVSFADNFVPRLDGTLNVSTDTRFPLYLTLFGAYDKRGMDLHGVSKTFGSAIVSQYALKEINQPKDLNLFWLAGGEAGVGLFSFNIQRNLSHLYFNRIYGSLAVRNQVYDSKNDPDAEGYKLNGDLRLVQSLALKLGMKISFFPLVKVPASIEPYVMGAWKFSNMITGIGSLWYIDTGFKLSL